MTDTCSKTTALMSPIGITALGMFVNFLLSLLKVLAGIFCNSHTILVDGLHSVSDMVTDAIVIAGLRISGKPADTTHHYGHLRITTLVAMIVGVILLSMAGWIIYRAIITINESHNNIWVLPPLLAAITSIAAKELLYRITHKVAGRTSNISLEANAWHHRTDAFTSIAAAAGLAGVALGGPSWAFLDNLTAVVLSVFLLAAGGKIFYESVAELIDRAPRKKVLSDIGQIVSETEGVQSYHAFRARKIGGKIAMDIHIQVDPELTVLDAHTIASLVRDRILESNFNAVDVVVHIEPGV